MRYWTMSRMGRIPNRTKRSNRDWDRPALWGKGGRERGRGEGEREREREHGGEGGYVACAEVQLCLLEYACTVPRCLLAHHHRSQLTVISN